MPNALVNEKSPYLLQHAHNPVKWFPWGEEALQKAKAEDKPILLSIGYSACHWCHVMERESFEDADTAALMNELYVNIKVDREERPDLDHIYMEAVQILTGSGGWPLNVFLTPDLKPFYGGTYFPPIPVQNRPSWTNVLIHLANAFKEKRGEVEEQANRLLAHIEKGQHITKQADAVQNRHLNEDDLHSSAQKLLQNSDRMRGGFGRAPKFLGTFSLRWMWWYAQTYAHQESQEQVVLSVDQMLMGGIYDQIGGGICRYSTDEHWLVPHFEKMLYDNALLLRLLADMHAAQKELGYDKDMDSIFSFLQREMTNAAGLFYSALDADSEGVEGKYYIWSASEIDALLGENAAWYKRYYNVSEEGNWEDQNILHRNENKDVFAASMHLDSDAFAKKVDECNSILLQAREKRIRPGLDNKIQLSWNALMNSALSATYMATSNEKYLSAAIKNMEAMKAHCEGWSKLKHILNNEAQENYFLEDLAFLGDALLLLYQASGNSNYAQDALKMAEIIRDEFALEDSVFYSFTSKYQKDKLLAKAEYYDGATASANSVINGLFIQLGSIFNDSNWIALAEKMNPAILAGLKQYPSSFSNWAMQFTMQMVGLREISIHPENIYRKDIQQKYDPFKLIIYAAEKASLPIGETITKLDKKSIQFCYKQSCFPLYQTWEDLCAEHYKQ